MSTELRRLNEKLNSLTKKQRELLEDIDDAFDEHEDELAKTLCQELATVDAEFNHVEMEAVSMGVREEAFACSGGA